MGLPVISVEFKKLADTARARSVRGILAVILQDGTASWAFKEYGTLAEVNTADFTSDNYIALSRAFDAGPYKVVAVRVAENGTMEDAGKILDNLAFNWVCAVPTAFQAGLVTYVKGINVPTRVRKAKAVVAAQQTADDMHIVSVANTKVTVKGASTSIDMVMYLPRLAGVLASTAMDASCTYYPLDDLADVVPVTGSIDTAIDGGSLCLFKDDDTVRIARGVNTLKTLTGDKTADMKKIAVVEAMDLIQEDIIRTFKTYYLGKKKNTADNQALFIADILNYLNELAMEDVVSRDEAITAEINVPAMRRAWDEAGVSTADLSDAQVKKKTYRSSVFVRAQARILDAMEDLTMVFTMG